MPTRGHRLRAKCPVRSIRQHRQLRPSSGQPPVAELTRLKVELAFLPIAEMAAMQTTTMRANITAYSTAVGPSSLFTNNTTVLAMLRISDSNSVRMLTLKTLCVWFASDHKSDARVSRQLCRSLISAVQASNWFFLAMLSSNSYRLRVSNETSLRFASHRMNLSSYIMIRGRHRLA